MSIHKHSNKKNRIIRKKKTIKKNNKKINRKKIIGGNGIEIDFNNETNLEIFIPYSRFKPLFKQNKDKILIPSEQIGKYSFKEHAFDHIKENIEKSYIDNNKNNNQKTQKNIEKNVFLLFIQYLKDTIQYIKFDEYLKILEKVCKEIKEKIINNSEYQTIILCSEGNMTKSNFWVLLLCLIFLDDDITRVMNNENKKIYLSSNIDEAYNYLFAEFNKNENYKTQQVAIIYFDDMSYSGQQIHLSLPLNKNDIPFEDNKYFINIFLGIGFISTTAIKTITDKHRVNLFDSTKKIESNYEQLQKWMIKNQAYIFKLFPKLISEYEEEKLIILSLLIDSIYGLLCGTENILNYNTISPPYDFIEKIKTRIQESTIHQNIKEILLYILKINYKKAKVFYCYQNIIPIYFDHKVADAMSTFEKFIRLGEHPTAKDESFEAILEHCDVNTELKEKYKHKKNAFLNADDQCPQAFYKLINYTFKNGNNNGNNNENIIKTNTINSFFS